MIDIADLAVGQSRMLYGRTMHSERTQHRMYEQWHPLGVVGIITAFNFPVAVWSWNALLAAVCGNACVWKPSPKTPLCALAVQRLCEQVLKHHNAPPVFQLLLDAGSELGARLAADRARQRWCRSPVRPRSGARSRRAWRRGSASTLLELGGNNAIIVDETADLDLAARAIVFGALGTAGQRCTTHAAGAGTSIATARAAAAAGACLPPGAHRRSAGARDAGRPADRSECGARVRARDRRRAVGRRAAAGRRQGARQAGSLRRTGDRAGAQRLARSCSRRPSDRFCT